MQLNQMLARGKEGNNQRKPAGTKDPDHNRQGERDPTLDFIGRCDGDRASCSPEIFFPLSFFDQESHDRHVGCNDNDVTDGEQRKGEKRGFFVEGDPKACK